MQRNILWFGVAVTLLGGGLLRLHMQRLEAETSGGPRQRVLVAQANIEAGTALAEHLVATREIPQAYVDLRHIDVVDAQQVLGQPVAVSVRAGESLLWTDLRLTVGGPDTLAMRVRPGMRALGVSLADTSLAAMLRPGDRVDVLTTQSPAGSMLPGASAARPQLLLQNVMVLAVGTDIGGDDGPRDRDRGGSDRVTLSVAVMDAQILVDAMRTNRVTLALRNADDADVLQQSAQTEATTGQTSRSVASWLSQWSTGRSGRAGRAAGGERVQEIEHVR